jgi:hypothetical protein
MQIKRLRSDMVIAQEMVESWIVVGDNIWYTCMEEEEDNDETLLQDAFYASIADAGLVLKDGTEIVPYDEEWDHEEVVTEDDLDYEFMDHNCSWDIDDVGIPNTTTTEAVGTNAKGTGSTQYVTPHVNGTEEATNAKGARSTQYITSRANGTEAATDAEGARSTQYVTSHENVTKEATTSTLIDLAWNINPDNKELVQCDNNHEHSSQEKQD